MFGDILGKYGKLGESKDQGFCKGGACKLISIIKIFVLLGEGEAIYKL